jgi:hypothetical protein
MICKHADSMFVKADVSQTRMRRKRPELAPTSSMPPELREGCKQSAGATTSHLAPYKPLIGSCLALLTTPG